MLESIVIIIITDSMMLLLLLVLSLALLSKVYTVGICKTDRHRKQSQISCEHRDGKLGTGC